MVAVSTSLEQLRGRCARFLHQSSPVSRATIEHMNAEPGHELHALIRALPEGWTRVRMAGQDWGITRTTRAGGRVMSFDADRLDNTERFGANGWVTSEGLFLRPCEVPAEKVMQLLRDAAATLTA
jgi:hypothetical protein